MIFQPTALALLLAATLIAILLAGCGLFALHLLRHWNAAAGSEMQIALERRTYLVSTLVALSLGLSLPMLALFVHNADAMAPFFSGAMCAVGSLKVNAWGMPALLTLLASFFIAAAWLLLNHLDSLGWDTPLIRPKYRLLLLLAPLSVAQAVFLWLYYLDLNPEVITSCCGSLFGPEAAGVAAEVAALPLAVALPLFWGVYLVTLSVGVVFLWRQRLGIFFSLLVMLNFAVTLMAVVAFIAPYIYEQPQHHCPFCLLQAEHGYAGWLLYLPLFLATVAGLGVGLAASVRAESLLPFAPRLAINLAKIALAALLVLGLLILFYIYRSNLVLLN
jgi:hypothetical protein